MGKYSQDRPHHFLFSDKSTAAYSSPVRASLRRSGSLDLSNLFKIERDDVRPEPADEKVELGGRRRSSTKAAVSKGRKVVKAAPARRSSHTRRASSTRRHTGDSHFVNTETDAGRKGGRMSPVTAKRTLAVHRALGGSVATEPAAIDLQVAPFSKQNKNQRAKETVELDIPVKIQVGIAEPTQKAVRNKGAAQNKGAVKKTPAKKVAARKAPAKKTTANEAAPVKETHKGITASQLPREEKLANLEKAREVKAQSTKAQSTKAQGTKAQSTKTTNQESGTKNVPANKIPKSEKLANLEKARSVKAKNTRSVKKASPKAAKKAPVKKAPVKKAQAAKGAANQKSVLKVRKGPSSKTKAAKTEAHEYEIDTMVMKEPLTAGKAGRNRTLEVNKKQDLTPSVRNLLERADEAFSEGSDDDHANDLYVVHEYVAETSEGTSEGTSSVSDYEEEVAENDGSLVGKLKSFLF
ncbi:hypothetical protein GNI_078820 [Gregarina niphandrodes]|uniref:Uncharacterized protein n=1 Tax=Gregarina niphandrodes TaxID=110365 RepID=A0A023B6K5_GRENI|nr:hypothetical protein GNI_078820 [Gregarina niphandrodes]EZG66595.1 hypothetical protein GNI_078820 [Gregarina niphandrodes]|eukprot:XP_011130581.1 hypothetical protein GNI_078820 [Gregarina niphandrodes]